MRRAGLGAVAAVAVATALMLGCRAIAGIDGDLTYAPATADARPDGTRGDAARRDAGHDAGGGTDATRQDARDAARSDAGHDADSGHDAGHPDSGEDALPADGGPDVFAPDASGCPASNGETVVNVNSALGTLFLSPSYVYANLVSPDQLYGGVPYTGLVACPKTGCAKPRTLVDDADASVQWGSAAAGATALYYARSSPPGDGSALPDAGSIATLGFDGGPGSSLVDKLQFPFLVALSADSVYWLDDPSTMTDDDLTSPWRVFRCPLQGCVSPELFMEGTRSETFQLLVDATRAYVVAIEGSLGQTGVYACPTDGGGCRSPSSLLSGLVAPTGEGTGSDPLFGGDTLASDPSYLYWSNSYDDDIARVDPNTGFLTLLVPVTQATPTAIALDDTYVYFAMQANGLVQRVAKDGTGDVQTVLCHASGIGDIAVDSTHLYYTLPNQTSAKPETAIRRVVLP